MQVRCNEGVAGHVGPEPYLPLLLVIAIFAFVFTAGMRRLET